MTRIRTRVERLERDLVGPGGTPPAIRLAINRMRAREALFEEMGLSVVDRLRSKLAIEEGRPVEPTSISHGHARRFNRARQLLGDDNETRHRADRDAVLDWELRTRGKPGPFAKRWAGDWQRRRLTEILDELDAKYGV